MRDEAERGDWRHRCERIWKRVRDAIYEAVNTVLGPPPADVLEKIEDVLGRAKRDFNQKEETPKCQDEANGKQ